MTSLGAVPCCALRLLTCVLLVTGDVLAFGRYKHDFLAGSSSAWRPCQEGTEWLGRVCTRRRLLVSKATLLQLAEHRKLPLQDFAELFQLGAAALVGWETVCPEGEAVTAESIPELGGVCVGIIPGEGGGGCGVDGMATDRLWLACAITKASCECFASKLEVGGLIARLRGELGLQIAEGGGGGGGGGGGAAAVVSVAAAPAPVAGTVPSPR